MLQTETTCAEACYASKINRFISGYCIDPLICSIPVSLLFRWLNTKYDIFSQVLPYARQLSEQIAAVYPKEFADIYASLTYGDFYQQLVLIAVMFLYYFIAEAFFGGKTVGRYFNRTVLVDMDGNAPSVWRILLRTICRIIVPFDKLSFLFGAKWYDGTLRGAWHDKLSGTYVVEERLLEMWKEGRYDGSDRVNAYMSSFFEEQIRNAKEEEECDEQSAGYDRSRRQDSPETGERKLRVEDLYPQDDDVDEQ